MNLTLRRWSLLMTLLFAAVPLVLGGGLFAYYVKDELETRRMLSFLNFEQLAYRFDESLPAHGAFTLDKGLIDFDHPPEAVLIAGPSGIAVQHGLIPDGLKLTKLSSNLCEVWRSGNQNYISCPLLLPAADLFGKSIPAGLYSGLWRLPVTTFAMFRDSKPHRIFILNRAGQIIYQSDARYPQDALLKKPLVQAFIRSPLTKEATAPYQENGARVLGFAMGLRQSNLVMFVESPASVAFAALWRPTAWVLGLLLIGVTFLIIVWRFILGSLEEQVGGLARSLTEFSRGLPIPTHHNKQRFLPELHPLVDALNEGTLHLRERLDTKEAPHEGS